MQSDIVFARSLLTQEDEEEGGGHDCVHDVCRLQLGTGGRDWEVELSTEVREVFTEQQGKGSSRSLLRALTVKLRRHSGMDMEDIITRIRTRAGRDNKHQSECSKDSVLSGD